MVINKENLKQYEENEIQLEETHATAVTITSAKIKSFKQKIYNGVSSSFPKTRTQNSKL